MTLYCVRHGQTDWNAEARFQGQQDIPLNVLGRHQAAGNGRRLREMVGEALGDYDFVASPLLRTRQTMELLREAAGLAPQDYRLDDRLKELSFGAWEGVTLEEIERKAPDDIVRRAAGKWSFVPPGERAESYADLSARIEPWYREIASPTVAVIHGGLIRALFHLAGGEDGEVAAELATPQDKILRIEGDRLDWL